MLHFFKIVFVSSVCQCQNFDKKTLQNPLKKLTARALMTLLACSPTSQNYAAKGNFLHIVGASYHLCFTVENNFSTTQ